MGRVVKTGTVQETAVNVSLAPHDIALVEDKGLPEKVRVLRTSLQISEDGTLISDFPLGRCSPSFVGALVINQLCNGWAHRRDEKGQPIELYRTSDKQG